MERYTSGYIENWDTHENKWCRYTKRDIVLKSLNNSQNITTDFLQEVCNLLFIIDVISVQMYLIFN